MNHYNSLKMLYPVDIGKNLDSKIAIDGYHLDKAYNTIMSVLNELFPATSVESISRWEKEYGSFNDGNLSDRQNGVVSKKRQQSDLKNGGLRKSLYVSIAGALGYSISILESSQPFRAGISRAGDPVYSSSALWTATIAVQGVSSAPSLEALLNDIFPPWIRLVFEYV